MTSHSNKRLLVLVPHEPELDPRIAWVLGLCREVGRTDVIATTWATTKPVREYDGVVSIERVDANQYAAPLARRATRALRLDSRPSAHRFRARQGRPPEARSVGARVDHHLGAVFRLAAAWAYYALPITALHRRGRSVSVPPAALVCHDLYSLIPGVLLKRRFGSALLYDSHEYFPEADLLAPRWQVRLIRALERRLIRRADVVVTVSPPLAREFERVYDIGPVLSVPNAEPRPGPEAERPPAQPGEPIRFLVQGQASPGRGFERLFELWSNLDEPRALLQIRCPDGDYPRELRERFASLFGSGRAEWLEPVSEDKLVSAAASSDVGVIPYVGPSLNHVYACPNKLSQYMAAGLAILSSADLAYVGEVVGRYGCGLTYRPGEPGDLARAVHELVGDPETLERMRRNAREAAVSEFNWETLSQPYRRALEQLAG